MDDVEIDRALHATLSADPSPGFVARVRAKIADAPRPSILAGWFKPAAAIACAAIVAIAVGWPRETEIAPAAAGLKPSSTYVPPNSSVVVPTFAPAVALAKAGRSARPANEPPFPEVIIATDDVEALQAFVGGARDRRFVATFEEAPTPTVWAMNDLAIAPITVEPLDPTQSHNN